MLFVPEMKTYLDMFIENLAASPLASSLLSYSRLNICWITE